jgi:hypothetical protein
MQLVAGRTGQEYNRRKQRKGAFWEDRYHATAVDANAHLARCLIYLDLNMVRAGVVSHPHMWAHGGHKEILNPPNKYRLLARERLKNLLAMNETTFTTAYLGWLGETMQTETCREPAWSESVAVSDKGFVERVKEEIGFRACGRKVYEGLEADMCVLREATCTYGSDSDMKNGNLNIENGFPWNKE